MDPDHAAAAAALGPAASQPPLDLTLSQPDPFSRQNTPYSAQPTTEAAPQRLTWLPEMEVAALKALLAAQAAGETTENGFKPKVWNQIATLLASHVGHAVGRDQVKNKIDMMKRKYMAWREQNPCWFVWENSLY